MLYSLQNPIQNYAWGSTSALNELFGIPNALNEPQAEVWMGAHPNGCSLAHCDDQAQKLSDLIACNPEQTLGDRLYNSFGELPYLLKILSADKPLSIQVHPKKDKAAAGFALENESGLSLSAKNRNYRDANHKPELIYALTPFKAMNAFRPISDTVDLFQQSGCTVLESEIAALAAEPTEAQLKRFFLFMLRLQGEQKDRALAQLLENIEHKGVDEPSRNVFATAADLSREYPGDMGAFAPLYLNVVELQPGEAMFLHAETPHAYLKGSGVEVMANSDNVLRAGLTPKHMDIDELVANTRFAPVNEGQLCTQPVIKGRVHSFPVPVDDFKFDIIKLGEQSSDGHQQSVCGAEILLCIDGQLQLKAESQELTLCGGESAFVAASTTQYELQGHGQMVRISA